MSRKKAKPRRPQPPDDRPAAAASRLAAWWWPAAFFAIGLAAAFVVRQVFQDVPDQPARPATLPGQPAPQGRAETSPQPTGDERLPENPPARDTTAMPRQLSPSEALFAKHLRQGYDDFMAGRYDEALQQLTTAARIDPTVPDTYHFMGEVYQNLLLLDKAEQAYHQALSANSQYTLSRKRLAVLLYDRGRYDEAVALLEPLRKERPRDASVLGELALNAMAQARLPEAIELLEKYNQMEGRQAWGYAHLGRACADAGDLPRAEKAYREALAIAPTFSIAHYWLGQLLASTGRTAESKKSLAEYRRLRSMEDEVHQLKMTLLRDPDNMQALVSMARLRYLLGDPDQSLGLLQRALRLNPRDEKLVRLHGEVAAAVQRKRAASPTSPRAAPR